MEKYVSYVRVSTDRQGISGLGLDAQRKAITDYIDSKPDAALGEEFIEVESGKRSDNRPELQAAIAYCKRNRATLIIAKLDRLARNVHFISGLMESGIEFVAVDNPNANRLMLHMLAAFAEHERECISKRTKEALAQARLRGVVLGKNGKVLAADNKAKAVTHAKSLEHIITAIKAEGYLTLRAISEQLNQRGIPSPEGKSWHLCSVHRLVQRINVG